MGDFVAFGFCEMIDLASEESRTILFVSCRHQALWRCINLGDPALAIPPAHCIRLWSMKTHIKAENPCKLSKVTFRLQADISNRSSQSH